MGAKLNKLGIFTIADLIYYYPRDYRDFTQISKIADLEHIAYNQNLAGGRITIKGKILGIHNKKTSQRRFTVTEAIISDNTGTIKVVWFNQPFLSKMLPAGRELILNGKVAFNFFDREFVMESPSRALKESIEPVYSETAGLTSNYIAKLIKEVLKFVLADLEEWLPSQWLGSNFELLPIQEAILNIHFPKNQKMLEAARRRIAFDELFLIALRANLSKEEIKKERAPEICTDDKNIAEFKSSLPFDLTDDQKEAVEKILADLRREVPMNRLLNGDVGSGKTVVAAIAAYAAVLAGYRVALMAPTEILAKQHFKTFCHLFEYQQINISLWTSSSKNIRTKKSKLKSQNQNLKLKTKSLDVRCQILAADILIGTQALIQDGIELENLGLVIVDEQHRFGVKQRAVLLQTVACSKQLVARENKSQVASCEPPATKKMRPHFLSMTATPIPRTLYLALFGDLDLTIIKEKPVNRKEIKTRFVEPRNRQKAYEFIKAHLKAGRQAFIVCPLIEDGSKQLAASSWGNDSNEKSQATSYQIPAALFEDERKTVKREHEKLQRIFPEYKIGMLHGRMKAKEKDGVMEDFSSGKLNILVSTSVVEVGVDVPNASIMVVEDAERFGLAQLHQFRGRVGRADHQSFCFLFSSTTSDKAINRLKALESTSDGFKLAEIDLEQRGPGAIFGTEQSGLLDLKMASFSNCELIDQASMAAKSIVEADPELNNYPLMQEKISNYFQNRHLE